MIYRETSFPWFPWVFSGNPWVFGLNFPWVFNIFLEFIFCGAKKKAWLIQTPNFHHLGLCPNMNLWERFQTAGNLNLWTVDWSWSGKPIVIGCCYCKSPGHQHSKRVITPTKYHPEKRKTKILSKDISKSLRHILKSVFSFTQKLFLQLFFNRHA